MTDKQNVNISFAIDSQLHRTLKIYCVSSNKTIRSVVEDAILDYLNIHTP